MGDGTWVAGGTWADLRSRILDRGGVWTLVTENSARHVISVDDGTWQRLPKDRAPWDVHRLVTDGPSVSTSCGLVLLRQKSPARLGVCQSTWVACAVPLPPDHPAVHGPERDGMLALALGWTPVHGHPEHPCGALYCPRSAG